MAKQDPFTAHVLKASATAPAKAIASALGALVTFRAKKRAYLRTTSAGRHVYQPGTTQPYPTPRSSGQRRSPRRIGRIKAYTPTSKPDMSRAGTFRHYMISTIRKHSDTRSAEQDHALCDNADWATKWLDFNWAVDNGFINWA